MDDKLGAIGLIMAVLYLVPTIVAYKRKHPSVTAIAATNIILGWTGIGWLVALIWGLTKNATNIVVEAPQSDNKAKSNLSTADELEKLSSLKDKGILDEEEFKKQKEKLLNA